MDKKYNSRKKTYRVIVFFSLFFLTIIISLSVYWYRQAKEKEDAKNLVGYTLQSEQLADTCNLVEVEGFYLGKGVLNGEVHYIFQAEKNGQKSNNIDVTAKEIEIVYVSASSSTSTPDKPGTVKAYERFYIKKDKKENIKKENRYFYKVYIPEGTIKDCGELTTSSENSSDNSDE